MADNADKVRDAIAKTAAAVKQQADRTGADISHRQAREMVENARYQGDRKRENNNR